MIRVQLKNVTKVYTLVNTGGFKNFILNFFQKNKIYRVNKFIALENVSFDVYDGEVVGIIGRNGAGKSTTLSMIAKVLKPTSGSVSIKGRIAPLLELGAGFHHDLTGRENIVLNGVLLGLSRKEILNKIDEIISFAELEEFIDQPIRVYSSGMMARLGFSIAIQVEPEILLIDEVLSVGDQSFQKKSSDKIDEFRKKGTTIIFVSHDIATVERICDKVVWIDQHKVKMNGKTNDVVPEYKKFFGE